MFEFIAATWFLVIGSIWTLGILGCFVLWLVHEESDGWALLWLAVFSAIAYWIFKVDTMTLLIGVAAYIPIGVCWSFYRWKRYCTSAVESYNERKTQRVSQDDVQGVADLAHWTERNLESLKDDVAPGNNITRLVNWILIWPFSVIDNVLGDLYDMVVTLVKKHLINLYTRISSKALDNVE